MGVILFHNLQNLSAWIHQTVWVLFLIKWTRQFKLNYFFHIYSNRQNQECRQKFEVTWLQQLDGTNSTTVWPLQVPYWWEQLEVWYLRPKYLRNPPCFLQVKLTFIFFVNWIWNVVYCSDLTKVFVPQVALRDNGNNFTI